MTELNIYLNDTWSISLLPTRSIALDGFVRGPHIDTIRQIYSFDHHENCIRHVTQATCQQVYDALQLGLDPSEFGVYVNDIDGDTVLSVFLLFCFRSYKNQASLDRIQKLVYVVGKVDAHGHHYPLSENDKEIRDVFYKLVMDPVNRWVKAGKPKENDSRAEFFPSNLMCNCVERLRDVIGRWPQEFNMPQNPDEKNAQLYASGNNWVMIRTEGPVGFSEIYDVHQKDAGVLFSKLPNGRWQYTIAKKSEFVRFPVCSILEALARRENGWGGGSTIGGSPRGVGSILEPLEVLSIIKAWT